MLNVKSAKNWNDKSFNRAGIQQGVVDWDFDR